MAYDVPDRLKRKGRAAVPFDDPDELLHRRVPTSCIDEDEQISASGISGSIIFDRKGTSVNRERFCESPYDVLYGPDRYRGEDRVISWAYRDIKVTIPGDGGSLRILDALHLPEELMYPHSELQCFKDGGQQDQDASNAFKKAIRTLLTLRAIVQFKLD